MEHNDTPLYEGDSRSQRGRRQAYAQQAPSSLLSAIEDRLQERERYLTEAHTEQEFLTALHDERWEMRSAAVEAPGIVDEHTAFPHLLEALSDESPFVRISALRTLGKLEESLPANAMNELLATTLDQDWQVREMAMLTLGELRDSRVESALEAGLHDLNSNVRDAAQQALRTLRDKEKNSSVMPPRNGIVPPSERREGKQERGPALMKQRLHVSPLATDTHEDELARISKRFRGLRLSVVLVATAALALALMAAGTFNGWWNPLFGNADLYQSIGQQQSSQGVTITVTKVYADEGRTIIAFDMSSANANKNYLIGTYNLSSSIPQKQDVLSATQCDAPQSGVSHCYMVQSAFLVPANATTLPLTLDVQQLVQSGNGNGVLSGRWHFSFTVPFHHENRHDIPNPIHGEQYLH